MYVHHLHDWDVSPQDAIAIQLDIADKLIDDTPLDIANIHHIAGVDVSVKDNVSTAAVIVLTYPGLEVVESVITTQPTPFPYIPGLLTFREGPVLVEAFEKLQHDPDVFMFDGMGRIHPRRMGIAAHLGLWLQRPSVGIGKTHFIGQYDAPGIPKGSYSPITDNFEIIGNILRTRTNVKPVYVICRPYGRSPERNRAGISLRPQIPPPAPNSHGS